MKTKIRARYIVGYQKNDHAIYQDAELVYEDDRILFVGYDYPGPVDRVIEAGNALLSPGFIDLNALGDIDHDLVHLEAPPHLHKSLLWSEEYFSRQHGDVHTSTQEAFKSLYAYAHLILNGVTTAMPITSVLYKGWAETYEELEAAAANAARLGLRIYLGPSYQSGMRVVHPDGTVSVAWREALGEAGLQRAVEFIQKYDGAYQGLVRGMLAPERVESITPDLLVETRRWSDELGCPVRLHAAQGVFEVEEIYRRHTCTPVRFLFDLGFLGSRVCIPHGIYVSGYSGMPPAVAGSSDAGEDLAILAESGATVIACPVIMARHGQALESFGRYSRRGVRLAMGTDTFPPDIFQNLRLGSYLARVKDGSLEGNTFADLYRAATLGGAAALGRQDLGRLAPGAKADMFLVNLGGFHFGVQDDPIRTLLITASGTDIHMVIINGRTVMQDRRIEGVDLQELADGGQKIYETLRRSYVQRDYLHHSETELIPPSFPTVQRKEASAANTLAAEPAPSSGS